MYSIIVAEFHEEIRMAIRDIVDCLKDSAFWVRSAAIDGLLNIAPHGTCYHLSPSDILNHDSS